MLNQVLRQIKLRVAEIVIEVRCGTDIGLRLSPDSQPFSVNEGQPDCVLNVHYGSLPDIKTERQLFDSGNGAWALYSSGPNLVFKLLCGHGQAHPYRLAVFEPGFTRGDLYVSRDDQLPVPLPGQEEVSIDPFVYPLDELLVVNLLSQGRGLHIHALGVAHDGRGLVFCGVSGAGKSTLAELWKTRQVPILSDDRISLRRQDGKVWVYGTPWHGDARVSLPEKAPLREIYFIKHGQENRIIPLSATEVATRLLVRCFPTFYLRDGMEYTLGFITELAQDVPCFELQFTPDQRAVDKVLSHVDNGLL